MRCVIVGALLLLSMGCGTMQMPSWVDNAKIMTDSPKEFFDGSKSIDPK
jgi:hypothetical protein